MDQNIDSNKIGWGPPSSYSAFRAYKVDLGAMKREVRSPDYLERSSRVVVPFNREDSPEYYASKNLPRAGPSQGSANDQSRNSYTEDLPPSKGRKRKWTSRFAFTLPGLGEPGGLDDPLRKGMNGATAKRYLNLLHEGKQPQEARDLAIAQKAQATDQNKAATGGCENRKRPRTEPSPSPGGNSANIIKVAIAAREHHEIILNKEDLKEIEDALVYELGTAKNTYDSIQFSGIAFKPGMILLNCQNDETIGWLKKVIPNLKQWRGVDLKVYVGDDIPHNHVITIFLPRSADKEDLFLLSTLKNQNKDLNVGSWKVLKSKRTNGGVLMHIGVDDLTRERITKQKDAVYFRFGTIPVSGKKANKGEMP